MKIQVLLCDDHRLVREGLRSLLDREPDIEVVGEAGGGEAAVKMAGKLKPHVVLMDVTMGGMNGIEATRKITQEIPDIKVVALSMHIHSWFIERMLEAGAKGYIPKHTASADLIRAIHSVFGGETYLSPGLCDTGRRRS